LCLRCTILGGGGGTKRNRRVRSKFRRAVGLILIRQGQGGKAIFTG